MKVASCNVNDSVSSTVDGNEYGIDESQTVVLDADGFLKLKQKEACPPFEEQSKSVLQGFDNFCELENDILDMCSGNFVREKHEASSIPSSTENKHQSKQQDGNVTVLKNPMCEHDEIETSTDATNSPLFSKNQIDTEKGDLTNYQNSGKRFAGFCEKIGNKRTMKTDFIDDEAELSGSEAESDEDDDLNDAADVMDVEAGDNDIQMSAEALKNQVTKVHMKCLLDEDERELRLVKEMYLQDGDLHTDGVGRKRRFRWKHIDEPLAQSAADVWQSEEIADDGLQVDQWRQDRFERNRYLTDQHGESTDKQVLSEKEVLRLGKVTVKSTNSRGKSILDRQVAETECTKSTNSPAVSLLRNRINNLSNIKSGSLLNRNKDKLAQIAQLNKQPSNVLAQKSCGSFVFSACSNEKTELSLLASDRKDQLKRVCSNTSQPPLKKKRKQLDDSSDYSLFNELQ